jgi:two-component sensor histidine kinase
VSASVAVSASSPMKPFAYARTAERLTFRSPSLPSEMAQGKIVGASKIARDISERKRSEAHIAILAREAEHRAKNVLATVQATVHLSHSDTPDGLKHAIEGRIRALANVHTLFVESRWTGAELHSLVKGSLPPTAAMERNARVSTVLRW